MNALGRRRVRIVNPPVGMHCGWFARPLDRRRHGVKLARLSVESGEIALDHIRPDLRVAWRKTETQDVALVHSRRESARRRRKIMVAVF